jgi:type II secretory pathway component GspD/PulD (secretin)
LIVTNTPQIQAELREFLDDLRQIAGLMVSIEVRFISVEDDFLQDFGIDFRGLGGPATVPNQANITLEDVQSGNEDLAGGQFDNGAGGIAPANPSAGVFFNDQDPGKPPVNFNQDIRGRFEHIYDNALGNVLTNNGGFAMQFAYFVDLTQINAVIHAVQKRKKARVLTAPRLSAFNTQRSNITIVNQIPYVRDFDLQTATASAIANPVIDTILDGMVLDVKPTVSNDRRFVTIEVQPTVAELVLPIPTFTTTLGPTSAVTIQVPEVKLQTVQTTVRVPDGGAVVVAGLKTVRDVWFESSVPILGDIPLLGVLFKSQGVNKEQYNRVIVVYAKIVDLNDEEAHRPGWGGN